MLPNINNPYFAKLFKFFVVKLKLLSDFLLLGVTRCLDLGKVTNFISFILVKLKIQKMLVVKETNFFYCGEFSPIFQIPIF